VPGFLSCGSYECLYSLPVIRRYEAVCARIAVTARLGPSAPRSGPSPKLGRLAVGNKKTKAGQGTPRNDCVTEVDGPMQGFRLPARMRGHGAGRVSRNRFNVTPMIERERQFNAMYERNATG